MAEAYEVVDDALRRVVIKGTDDGELINATLQRVGNESFGFTVGPNAGREVCIAKIFPGSLASRSALREGDVLLHIGGYGVKGKSVADIRRMVQSVRSKLRLVLRRGGDVGGYSEIAAEVESTYSDMSNYVAHVPSASQPAAESDYIKMQTPGYTNAPAPDNTYTAVQTTATASEAPAPARPRGPKPDDRRGSGGSAAAAEAPAHAPPRPRKSSDSVLPKGLSALRDGKAPSASGRSSSSSGSRAASSRMATIGRKGMSASAIPYGTPHRNPLVANVDRKTAEAKLSREAPGCFVVRPLTNPVGAFAIAIKTMTGVEHFTLDAEENDLALIVNEYKTDQGGLPVKLTTCVSRR